MTHVLWANLKGVFELTVTYKNSFFLNKFANQLYRNIIDLNIYYNWLKSTLIVADTKLRRYEGHSIRSNIASSCSDSSSLAEHLPW